MYKSKSLLYICLHIPEFSENILNKKRSLRIDYHLEVNIFASIHILFRSMKIPNVHVYSTEFGTIRIIPHQTTSFIKISRHNSRFHRWKYPYDYVVYGCMVPQNDSESVSSHFMDFLLPQSLRMKWFSVLYLFIRLGKEGIVE